MTQLLARIPRERIGVLIGPDGRIKERIERELDVKLEVDSQTGDIKISLNPNSQDPSVLFKAKDYVLAIGRGFNPDRAYTLLRDEEKTLNVIDLREFFGRSPSNIKRVKGRIIGKDGKTRRIIEELSSASISVYGYTISIIGDIEQSGAARQAIEMLIKGSQHATVYNYLQRKRQEFKKRRLELWEGRELVPVGT